METVSIAMKVNISISEGIKYVYIDFSFSLFFSFVLRYSCGDYLNYLCCHDDENEVVGF